jgi:dinuclear metal center YbgI/SA1388 family protein
MDLHEVVDRLDEELRTDDYADVDASANGLQVGPGGDGTGATATVDRVAFAVDAARATCEAAAEADADLLVTHHGLVWGGLDRVTGRAYRRIEPLVRDDVALYVSHLPLDGHPTLGNAAGVADLLGLDDRQPFGTIGAETVGLRGRLPEPQSTAALAATLTEGTEGDRGVDVLDFGPPRLRDVAVLTGSGTDWLDEAVAAGVDALVTGEGKQQVYHRAREAGIAVLLAGHYATETFGVRSLQSLVDDWDAGIGTTYLPHPTGL